MKKIGRILLKIVLGILALLLVVFIVLKIVFNDDVPQGEKGAAADELGYAILESINNKDFTQVKEIHWTFRGVNKYVWKVQQNAVDVYWEDYKVAYATQYPQISFAWKGDQKLSGKELEDAIAYASKNFNNDSFWVVAPYKIFDIGTERELIEEDGKRKLLVRYKSGGSTPGDVYLWEVDENNVPIAFKMWVSIIPFDGIEAKWSDWKMTDGGFPLPTTRSLYGIEIPVTDVKVMK
ncbi:MAG: hypothetical protein ABJN73_13140 [Nonlabens ulvanivorans]|uniref:hypothetical protein n=1 Tax=Nonlabens ulvanivorans TaxID=906888 RepID=UPI00326705C4